MKEEYVDAFGRRAGVMEDVLAFIRCGVDSAKTLSCCGNSHPFAFVTAKYASLHRPFSRSSNRLRNETYLNRIGIKSVQRRLGYCGWIVGGQVRPTKANAKGLQTDCTSASKIPKSDPNSC
jgi:hypothetical protein